MKDEANKKTEWTDEQLVIFHRVLRGVTEFKHDFEIPNVRYGGNGYQEHVCTKCKATADIQANLHSVDNWTKDNPCPVPDPWPDNDATLVSEIRSWIKDQPAHVAIEYYRKMRTLIRGSGWNVNSEQGYTRAMLFCDDEQKIAAFTKIHS